MKFIILFSLLLTNSVFASRAILEYRFGNQITGSELTIYEGGAISHGERTCCPPRTDTVSETKLSGAELRKLNEAIEASVQGKQIKSKGQATTEGSSSGVLVVYSSQLKKINIRTIARSSTGQGFDTVLANDAASAMPILEFAKSYVKSKMY